MRLKPIISIFFILISSITFSQEKFIALTISPELKKNSNAVIRSSITEVDIESIDKIIVKQHRIVTVFNESGQSKVNGEVYYDNAVNIKKLEAKIYNAIGEEVKRIKKKDFKDVSIADGFSIFNDNRAKYFNYTPVSYPYTVEFISETVRTNTAFIPRWFPLEDYYVSTEFSSFKVNNNSGIELSKRLLNFEDYISIEEVSEFNYIAKKIPALVSEAYSPSFTTFTPNLKVALKAFSMEGVEGTNTSWGNFGQWMNDKLIKGTEVLPESTKQEIKILTKDASSSIEKARIVYKYVQDKSRYVSIQVGIGGWKPMLASDVDRLGYGDCKGLTNYTKSLLETVGVESYYTVVYGDSNIRSIDRDFSSLEGNHVILTIPIQEDYVWLECTSQNSPFGYNANFTDDRDVLLVTSEGGRIVHTKEYKTISNTQETKADIIINEDGNIKAKLNIVYKGSQYDNHTYIESKDLEKQKLFYKDYYNINNLSISALKINNDKEAIVFTEDIELEAVSYASKAGVNLLFSPNLFNKSTVVLPKYKTRELPFEKDRGYKDVDEYTIKIPVNYSFESFKESINISNKFGSYKVTMQKKNSNTMHYKRELIINKGKYLKEDYKAFRAFYIEIVNHDKSRIAIANKK
ncbi:DUF3857 domain-containing protein [uncultured Lacinutrix sp.]|uniref:DUF3857 domain-containing protein n=1 Tax=uncultured Lacinutrix sp. TaxID=574032 RepID=UPI0026239A56|nr:DUF3857 domain-containing protein [uncultured Lacinutrix sp.]